MRNRAGRVLCGALLLFTTSCVVREQVVVRTPLPPPAPRVEVVPVTPGPAYVWVPGHWAWRGPERGYVWVAGHYAVPKAPGYVWVPGRWAARPGGYVWMEGHWRPR